MTTKQATHKAPQAKEPEAEAGRDKEWRDRAEALIQGYERGLDHGAPRTWGELKELRELLGVRQDAPMPDRLHTGTEDHLHDEKP